GAAGAAGGVSSAGGRAGGGASVGAGAPGLDGAAGAAASGDLAGAAGGGTAGAVASGDTSVATGQVPDAPDPASEVARAQSRAEGSSGLNEAQGIQSSAESRASGAQANAEGRISGATDVEGHARGAAAPVEGNLRGAEGDLRNQQREVQQFDSAGDYYEQRATVDAQVEAVEAAPDTAAAAATEPALEKTRGIRDADGAADRAKQDAIDRVGDGDFYDARATVDVNETGVTAEADGEVKKP
ncbi:MAG TPA: hypothetical protein VM261_17990, partial [Kofleriaceae bacterium]|nr:hypothetical protein [Kofleriaceae bacterium]